MGFLASILEPRIAYAHCDIPCGIYDPHNAQMAAHTVLRMNKMISELKASSNDPDFEERKRIINQIARFTKVKEDHAELVKHEVRVIWGDYFKQENYSDISALHEKVFKIMKLASKARQEVNIGESEKLIEAVLEFSEIFYKSKGFTPVRVKSPYPTEGDLVVYK